VTIGPIRTRSVAVAIAVKCDPRIGHVDDRLPPAHVIPHEHSVPAGLLGLGGQIGDERGIRELVEQRQEQA
jgi:hypothetical protein